MIRSVLCLLALGVATIGARAESASRIGVLPFAPLAGDVPQGAGEKGAEIFAKELRNQSEFEVVPREEAAKQDGTPAIAEARAAVAAARAAVGKHQLTAAIDAYQKALQAFAKGSANLDAFEEVVAAETELGVTLYRAGRDEEGEQRIFAALRLGGGQVPAAVAGAPSYAATLDALQKKLAQAAKGSIRVDSTPPGADVYVDGQSAGKTPVVLRDLPVGKHYLRALLPSGDRWGEVLDLDARSEPRLRAQAGGGGALGDVAAQLAENNLQPTVVAALKDVAAAGKVGLVIFGALHRTIDGLALDSFLFAADRGTVARLPRVAFDTEMLEAGLQMDKVVADVQQRLAGGGATLTLPGKAAPDVAAEHELATEFHFGGPGDVGEPSPSNSANTDEQPAEHRSRVVRKQAQPDSE